MIENNSKMEEIEEIKSQISRKRSKISNGRYYLHLVVFSLLWTASSFPFYVLQFMNKYYEGSIYVNFYLDGTAGILGSGLALLSYNFLKMRWAFLISTITTIIGIIFLLCLQQGALSPNGISAFMSEKSKAPEGSEQERQDYLAVAVPVVVFVTKIGVNMTF